MLHTINCMPFVFLVRVMVPRCVVVLFCCGTSSRCNAFLAVMLFIIVVHFLCDAFCVAMLFALCFSLKCCAFPQ